MPLGHQDQNRYCQYSLHKQILEYSYIYIYIYIYILYIHPGQFEYEHPEQFEKGNLQNFGRLMGKIKINYENNFNTKIETCHLSIHHLTYAIVAIFTYYC